MLRHKLNYLINASLHLYFQTGLILELGIRLIMDLVGQKQLFCFEYTELDGDEFPHRGKLLKLSGFCPCSVSSAISHLSEVGTGLSWAPQTPEGPIPSRKKQGAPAVTPTCLPVPAFPCGMEYLSLPVAELRAPWRHRLVWGLFIYGTLQVTLHCQFCRFLFKNKLLCQKTDADIWNVLENDKV